MLLVSCCLSVWADGTAEIGGKVEKGLFTELTLPASAETLGEGELPAGWQWLNPETTLKPGQTIDATAQYSTTKEERTVKVGRLAKITPEAQDYTQLSDENVVFESNVTDAAVKSFWLDGQELTFDSDIRNGQKFQLDSAFLDTLPVGAHSFAVEYPAGISRAVLNIQRDTEKPTGKITVVNGKMTISAKDNTGTVQVVYYLTDTDYTEEQLKDFSGWSKYSGPVSTNNRKNAYAKLTDRTGNVTYLCSVNMARDTTAPLVAGLTANKTYKTASGVRFTVQDSSPPVTVTLNGEPLKAQEDGSYLLTAEIVNATVTAADKWNNTTTIEGIKVEAGMDKPDTRDVNFNRTYEGSYSVPAAGEAVYSYRYDETPGKAVVTFDESKYTVTVNGKPAESPVTVSTGVAYAIRTNGVDGANDSDDTYFVIPALATATVSASAFPAEQGTIGIGEAAQSSLTTVLYSGQTITLEAAPKTGYHFIGWVNVRTGEVLSENKQYSFRAETSRELTARFARDEAYTIATPVRPKNVPVYSGEEITFMQVPDHTTLTAGKNAATNAGRYSFTLTPDKNYRWDDGTTAPKTFSWEIDKAATEKPAVSYDADNHTLSGLNAAVVYEAKRGSDGEVLTLEEVTAFSPVDEKGNTMPGTWFFRQAGDANHQPSPWAVVTVDYPTLRISNTGITELTENSARINLLLSTLEGVENVKLQYRQQGEQTWSEKVPQAVTNLSVDLSGLAHSTVYEYRLTTANVTSPIWSFQSAAHEPIPSTILAAVQNEAAETKVAVISVERNGTVLTARDVIVGAGEMVTTDPFSIPAAGVYNIVLKTADGQFTETHSLVVEENDEKNVSFVIEAGSFSSEVVVEGGAPAAAVDGLSQVLSQEEKKELADNKKSVSLVLNIAAKDLEQADGGEEISVLLEKENKVLQTLDISLQKKTTTMEAGVVVEEETADIGKANTAVLEIVFPNTYGTTDITLLRYHGGTAEPLRQLGARTETGGTDGTCFITAQYIYLYASGFSTYAIVRNTNVPAPPVPVDPVAPAEPEVRYFHITATAHEGGSITDNGTYSVAEYSSKTYQIEAAKGYAIRYVLVDGVNVGPVTSYTFTSVQGNHTIEVFFSGKSKRSSPQTSY